MVCLLFGVFPKVFRKPKNIRENQKYKRKPKKTKKPSGKTKTTKFSKVSDPPLDMGLFVFVCVFSRRFKKEKKKLSRKSKI